MDKKSLIVKCPSCKKEFQYYESKFRPFCTDRCQKVDLGHWLSETYTVPDKSNAVELEVENEDSFQEEYFDQEGDDSEDYKP